MDIVDRLQAKDETALIELMDQYGTYLKRMAYLMVRDEQLAEEIVQDAFVKLFYSIKQLREKEKLKSWLTMITYNLCRVHFRKKKISFLSIEKEDFIIEDEETVTPEAQLLKMSINKNLSDAILQLNEIYREVIVLHYYNAYTIKEITLLIKTKESTIKSRLARARQQLHQLLIVRSERNE